MEQNGRIAPWHWPMSSGRGLLFREWPDNEYRLANSPAPIDANQIARLDVNEPRVKTTPRCLIRISGKNKQLSGLIRCQIIQVRNGKYVAILNEKPCHL